MEELLEQLLDECKPYTQYGRLASYIPQLAHADIDDFGAYILRADGRSASAGDYKKCFSIQSVVKPILLLLALIDNGIDFVRSKVGVEATGKPFDAINMSDQALVSEHINPMVNMGAILMCNLIKGTDYNNKFERLLSLTREIACNPQIELDRAVYLSEKSTGNKNRALAFMLKANGLIDDEVEDLLDFYFKACSISVSSKDLACIGFALSNRGKIATSYKKAFKPEYAHYVNAILMTCGMYDGSGDFAVKVGVPAKSGVGGGIMAVVPTRMGIGIYSPGLDEKGNSVAGIKLFEKLSSSLYLSIF